MNRRMNRSKLNIGTYYLQPYARTEAHVKDLRDCGIDFVIGMQATDTAVLDLFEKYGVGCVVNDVLPGWWGGDGDRAGKLETVNPISAYQAGFERFHDHPAIWGVDIGDEPSALDFPYYGRVFAKVNSLFPNQFPYLNLYPNYASVAVNNAVQTVNQLGTATYAEHIDAYCREVPADYLCYDFYVYSCNLPKMYENLRIVADACRNSGRDMWIVLQVNSLNPDVFVSENQLRFQAHTAMAFGARLITWACYTAGWWSNQVLDGKGGQTEQYHKLKAVNAELHLIGNEYIKFRRTATHLLGFGQSDWLDGVGQASEDSFGTGVFRDVKSLDGLPLAVGEMTGIDCPAVKALYVADASDPFDTHPQTRTVSFTVDADVTVDALGKDGYTCVTRDKNGVCRVEIPASGGVLITAR